MKSSVPDKDVHLIKPDGRIDEKVVTFWEAIEMQKQGIDIYKLPAGGKETIVILQSNDMFLLGLSNEEFDNNKNNPALLSEHLYRVQKISSMYYTFRHHLASTVTNKDDELSIRSFKAYQEINPIKVEIDKLGNIKAAN